MRCDECKWWESSVGEEGFCRRNAPIPMGVFDKSAFAHGEIRGMWPMSNADDWCGEFQAKSHVQNERQDSEPEQLESLGNACQTYQKSYATICKAISRAKTKPVLVLNDCQYFHGVDIEAAMSGSEKSNAKQHKG